MMAAVRPAVAQDSIRATGKRTPVAPPVWVIELDSTTATASLIEELTAKTVPARGDTICVYSAEWDDAWPYAGRGLDAGYETNFRNVYDVRGVSPSMYASYRLRLDSSHMAFLLRVPGMYSLSEVDLWVYDERARRLGPRIPVAEAWGDAGYSVALRSWLVDVNGDGRLDLVQREHRSDTDLNSGKLRHESDSVWIEVWTGSGFSGTRTFPTSRFEKAFGFKSCSPARPAEP